MQSTAIGTLNNKKIMLRLMTYKGFLKNFVGIEINVNCMMKNKKNIMSAIVVSMRVKK